MSRPTSKGRHALPELDVETVLLDDWVRFWYKGELLPLPVDLQRDLDETRRQLRKMTRRAEEQARRTDAAEQELRRLRAELERMRTSR